MTSRSIKEKWKLILFRAAPWFLLLAGAWLLSHFAVQFMLIQGESMEPTYYSGQLVLVNRMSREFRVDQIIAFHAEGIPGVIVKRIAAGPGDEIVIKGGYLYRNGAKEAGDFDQMEESGLAENTITLGAEEYFVLGDNRNHSIDSRFEEIGIIKEEQIIGAVCYPCTEEEK